MSNFEKAQLLADSAHFSGRGDADHAEAKTYALLALAEAQGATPINWEGVHYTLAATGNHNAGERIAESLTLGEQGHYLLEFQIEYFQNTSAFTAFPVGVDSVQKNVDDATGARFFIPTKPAGATLQKVHGSQAISVGAPVVINVFAADYVNSVNLVHVRVTRLGDYLA